MSGMKKRVTLRAADRIMRNEPLILRRKRLDSPTAPPPPSDRIRSRPISTIQVGRMLISAMNRPLPVAVMAGAYRRMISAGGVGPSIELKVCRMPATVPIRPSSGNHSAAWARLVSQRSGRSSNAVPAPLQGPVGQRGLRHEQGRAQAEDQPVDVRLPHLLHVEEGGPRRHRHRHQQHGQERHAAEQERQQLLDQQSAHAWSFSLASGPAR